MNDKFISATNFKQKLEDYKQELIKSHGENDAYVRCLDDVLWILESEQAKRGEWWLQKIPFKGGHGQTATKYKCSNCKGYSHKKSPFCPNCGADM